MPLTILTGGIGHSETGTWAGSLGTERYTNSGPASQVFAFTGLTPGTAYVLGLGYNEFSNRVTNAAWSVAGTSGSPSGTIDEQAVASQFAGSGSSRVYLPQTFTPTGTTLTLTLSYPASPSPPGNYVEVVSGYLDLASNVNPIPTVAAGDWNTGSTWLFGSVPTGSTFASVGHAVTISADTTIGDGTNATVLTATTPGSSGLTVTGAKLTIRGNSSWGSYNPGGPPILLAIRSTAGRPAGVELDGNAGVAPVASFSSDSRVDLSGTTADRCYFRTKSGTAGDPGRVQGDGSGRSLQTAATCCDFARLGDASHLGWGDCHPGGAQPASFDRCTFAACGTAPSVFPDTGDADVVLDGCAWSGPAGSYTYAINASGVTRTTGTWRVARNFFNGGSAHEDGTAGQVTYLDNPPPTGYTLAGPSSGAVTVASGNFTVTPVGGGTYTGTITPQSTGSGTFSPTSLSFSGTPSAQTFTYTPSSASGSPHSISTTASPPIGVDPAALSYAVTSATATACTLTAPTPAKGDVTVASGDFTVTPDGPFTGTVTPHASNSDGTFTPASLTWSGTSDAKTFTYTPTLWGSRTVSVTNSGSLTNPSPVAYLGMVKLGSSGTAPSGNRCPSLGGFDLFANGAWFQEFKRDIRSDPVDPNSAAIMARFSGSPGLYIGDLSTTTANGGNSLYGIPINVVAGTQTTKTVTSDTYYAESDVDQTTHQAAVPVPGNPSVEGWYDAGGAPPTSSVGDQHILIAVRNETTGGVDTIWEMNDSFSSDSGATWHCAGLAKFDIATGIPRPEGYTSSDAAGLAILPILLKYEEVASGDVGHVIRGTFSNSMMMSRYTWPGRHETSQMGKALTYLAYGGRLRLQDSWYQANKASFTGQARPILDALAKYGLINSDGSGFGLGTGATIEGVNDERWVLAEIQQLHDVPMSAFEVITQHATYAVAGPMSGPVGAPATFTLTKYPAGDANFSGRIYLYVNGVGGGPGLSDGSVDLDDAHHTATYTFTPPSNGVFVLNHNQGNQDWIDAPDIVFTAGTPGVARRPPRPRRSRTLHRSR